MYGRQAALRRVDGYRWRRDPRHYNAEMHVPGTGYTNDRVIEQIQERQRTAGCKRRNHQEL